MQAFDSRRTATATKPLLLKPRRLAPHLHPDTARTIMGTTLDTSIRTDEAIRADVLSELKWDPKITSRDIAVAVANGVVALPGYVPTYWEKQAAEAAAKRVFGVRGVANDIEVKLSDTRTDPEIARDAIRELDAHAGVPAERIKVTVQAGWVTLEGYVDWEYQKDLAESAVRKLKGVIGVTNLIEVKPSLGAVEIKT
jgi:osmotically-inducible protein OsmY